MHSYTYRNVYLCIHIISLANIYNTTYRKLFPIMQPSDNRPKTQNEFNFNSFFSQQIQSSSFPIVQNFNSSSTNIVSQSIDCFNSMCYEQTKNTIRLRSQIYRQMQLLDQQRKKLFTTISIFSKKSQEQFRDQIRGQAPERKKRNRRNADQIQRNFICQQCNKLYGTQGSLAQHFKLKHSDQFQSQKKDQNSNRSYKQAFEEKL